MPKIAVLFGISIDTLFGISDYESTKALVNKYVLIKNDKTYQEAMDAILSLLDMDASNTEYIGLLVKLEYERGLEYLNKSKKATELLLDKTNDNDLWRKRAQVQLMRFARVSGEFDFVDIYITAFESCKTIENFNYMLIAMLHANQPEEAIRWGEDYLEKFQPGDQALAAANLMEAALRLGRVEYGKKYFDIITKHNEDPKEIFNGWWLLWSIYKKASLSEEALKCENRLLELLPDQGMDEYQRELFENYLNGTGDKPIAVL